MSMQVLSSTKIFATMWESEKKTVSFAANMWKQRDEAHAFILEIAKGDSEQALSARKWLRENTVYR